MRLTDADELIKDRVENDPVRIAAECAPTVFDKEKVIEDLNDWMKDAEKWAAKYDEVGDTDNMDLQDMAARCYKNAIEIVEKGGIE